MSGRNLKISQDFYATASQQCESRMTTDFFFPCCKNFLITECKTLSRFSLNAAYFFIGQFSFVMIPVFFIDFIAIRCNLNLRSFNNV